MGAGHARAMTHPTTCAHGCPGLWSRRRKAPGSVDHRAGPSSPKLGDQWIVAKDWQIIPRYPSTRLCLLPNASVRFFTSSLDGAFGARLDGPRVSLVAASLAASRSRVFVSHGLVLPQKPQRQDRGMFECHGDVTPTSYATHQGPCLKALRTSRDSR